jgi:type VI secretion system secreted protein VgrG
MAYTQANRLIAIETPLGPDVLLLKSMSGHEGISQLFNFELDLLSTHADIKFQDIIGKNVTIRIQAGDDTARFFNGFINRFRVLGNDVGLTKYQAAMVPWVWFLSRTTDCRIFQNLSIPDIIKKIFSDLGFSDFKFSLKGSYPARDYCVQYRETDFNFVSRLMEQEGIFYYFQHEEKKHTLVIGDAPSVHLPCPGQAHAKWNSEGTGILEESVVADLEVTQEFRPGKYALSDYNFETPSTSLMAQVSTTIAVGGNSKYEIYDYPGEYNTKAEGERLTKIRMQEEEAQHLEVSGRSNCRNFASGYRFKLDEYFRPDVNREYLLTSLHHAASVGNTYTSQAGGGTQDYENHFICIPYSVPFRPQRITPRPVVQGLQTAVVVGPSGEIIWCDKFGRVKVQFFWDREGKRDDHSSCWVRVSQSWGGKGWGGVSLPHIGQEVIISFMEGDSDHPLIIGRLYNAEVMPPLNLPADATKSIIQDHGGNVLTMEGSGGSQRIVMGSPTSGTMMRFGSKRSLAGSILGSKV